jgi:Flp pilus assembly protein TadG
MRINSRSQRRRGASAVEAAILVPVTFLLILGLIVGGMGVFRYQEVAALARQGARYASTHGANYRKDNGQPVGTAGTGDGQADGRLWYKVNPQLASGADAGWSQDVYDKAVRPNLFALDPTKLEVRVGWPPVINQSDKPDNWPGSTVAVTVSYQWFPEVFLVGPLNLTSTSAMPVTN